MLHIKCTHTFKQIPCQRFKLNHKYMIIRNLKIFHFNYKLFIYVFLIAITFQSCNYNTFDENNVLNCADIMFSGNKAYFNNELMSASCFIYDNNNNLVELRSYKNGDRSGLQRGYYIGTNKIEYEGYIKNGQIHGSYEKYHANGGIIQKGQFNKGFYSGKWEYFDENGDLTMNKLYSKRQGRLIDSILYK